MCEHDPCHCDCHEWAQPRVPSLTAQVMEWTNEYNAAVANGLVMKARRIDRRIRAVEVLLPKESKQ